MKILLEKNEQFLTIECPFTKRWRQKPEDLSPRHFLKDTLRLMPTGGITTFGLAHPPPSPPGDALRGGGGGWLRCSDAPGGHQAPGLIQPGSSSPPSNAPMEYVYFSCSIPSFTNAIRSASRVCPRCAANESKESGLLWYT